MFSTPTTVTSGFSVVSKRVVLGTYAFMFPRKELERRSARADPSTHEWTCLLRSGEADESEDISSYVKKVVFTLHPSFPQPQRTVESAPFEIHEVGWGEFEISCRVHFIDTEEKPIDLKHYLKLYPDNTQDIRTIQPPDQAREHCIATETYDEIVFRSPTDKMFQALVTPKPYSLPPHPLQSHFKSPPENQTALYLSMITLLQNCLITESDKLKNELIKLSSEIEILATIHYILHPERALQLMVNNPQLMERLVDGDDSSLAAVRTSLATLLAQSGGIDMVCGGSSSSVVSAPLNITKDRMNEIMGMFRKLLNGGHLSSVGFSLEGKKSPLGRKGGGLNE